MAKFNKSSTVEEKMHNHPDAITNKAGGLSFKTSAEHELYLRCVSNFIEDGYYAKASAQLNEIRTLIAKTSREFTLKLANYARNEMNLRSISTVLLAEASQEVFPGDKPGCSKAMVVEYAPKVIRRADEITEVLAYAINVLGKGKKKNLPNSLKKGVAKAFHNFDEYQFAKYNRKGDVTLKDAVLLTHPKPRNEEEKALFKRILDDKLQTPNTWEVKISTEGSTAENWDAVSSDMGIFALVRNLRNFEQKGAKEALKHAYSVLRDENKVLKSRMLPFRFLAALKEVSDNSTRDALHDAMQLSLKNLPKLKGDVAIFADVSGSMSTAVSKKSKMSCLEVATLMGAISAHLVEDGNNYYACAFATNVAPAAISKRDSVMTNQRLIEKADVGGHSTEAWKIFPHLGNKKFDYILVFSDMQCYNTNGGWFSNTQETLASGFRKYKSQVNPNAVLVSVDLASYGQLQVPKDEKNALLLGGFSDNIFKLINSYVEQEDIIQVIKNHF